MMALPYMGRWQDTEAILFKTGVACICHEGTVSFTETDVIFAKIYRLTSLGT